MLLIAKKAHPVFALWCEQTLKTSIASTLIALSLIIFAFPLQAGIGHDRGGASARSGAAHSGSVGGFNDNAMGREFHRESCAEVSDRRNRAHCRHGFEFRSSFGEVNSESWSDSRVRGEQRLHDRK